MEPSFWIDRWREGKIGFHEGQPNALLVRFAARLGLRHAAAVAGQVIKGVKAVEVVDGNLRHRFGILGQPQVHRDAPAALLVGAQRAPVGHAAAAGAEVEAQRLAAHIGLRGARNLDAISLKGVGPQRAVAAAGGAVAGGCAVGLAGKAPSHGTAQTGTLDHRVAP